MKRTPVRKVSKKKAQDDRCYYKLKKEYFENHETCEACRNWPAQDIHHKKGQGIYRCEVRLFLIWLFFGWWVLPCALIGSFLLFLFRVEGAYKISQEDIKKWFFKL